MSSRSKKPPKMTSTNSSPKRATIWSCRTRALLVPKKSGTFLWTQSWYNTRMLLAAYSGLCRMTRFSEKAQKKHVNWKTCSCSLPASTSQFASGRVISTPNSGLWHPLLEPWLVISMHTSEHNIWTGSPQAKGTYLHTLMVELSTCGLGRQTLPNGCLK